MIQNHGNYLIAGVDEAGRGPLAGPVYAAAVILDPNQPIEGLMDSKLLTAARRETLFLLIQQNALAWSIARADVAEIDEINILQAALLAMKRAVEALHITPLLALIDGNQAPKLHCEVKTIINGDQLEPAISAASILAKVSRDKEMVSWDEKYPLYGFQSHKGYATAQHLRALKLYGATKIHRRFFAPVAQAIELMKAEAGEESVES